MNRFLKNSLYIACTVLLIGTLAACSPTKRQRKPIERGVSHELALFRKKHFEQVNYQLHFSIPKELNKPVIGKVVITLQLKEKEQIIVDFRGESSQITALLLNGREVPYEVVNEHILVQATEVDQGTNSLAIDFIANDQSLNRREEFLYTLLVPDRARTLFPCFDQTNLKALFTLTLDLPSEWQAVANSPIERIDSLSVEGQKTIRFAQTEPLSTYLFSFVAGELTHQTFSRGERDIALYYRETDPKKIAQCAQIADEVFDALEWLEAYTAIPYPFAKYDCILLPGFQYGGMEHTGATLYNDRRMFLNENPTLNEQLGRSALIAHETAHMWFGDYVTMEWFNDVWTKEVFANYFASQMVEPLYPDVNHALNFMLDYFPAAYSEDRTAGSNAIQQQLGNLQDAGLVYGKIIYTKSPVVLDMLIRTMGKESYRKGIQEYLSTYAYGNATWSGLIAILDKYTPQDLQSWSHAWIEEKGMPHIRAEIQGDSLVVTQQDPWGRSLCWPQEISYLVRNGAYLDTLSISFDGTSAVARAKLSLLKGGEENRLERLNPVDNLETKSEENGEKATYTLLPNADGRAYGFFELTQPEAESIGSYLSQEANPVLIASLLITLYENVLNQTVSAEWYIDKLLTYLITEKNPLLYSAALGYVTSCQKLYPIEDKKIEQALWNLATSQKEATFALQAFRAYRQVAESKEAIHHLYQLWEKKELPSSFQLSESDYITLSYKLAMHLPQKSNQIVAMQLGRITNPDRQKEYRFIAPSVSPQKEVRDSLFQALLKAENRRIEPWAATALSHLNNSVWKEESTHYIRPGLELLIEVQRTGDIFFPTAWARALLAGHHSIEAREEVETFFADHPSYPTMLGSKIKQQTDHLYRLKRTE